MLLSRSHRSKSITEHFAHLGPIAWYITLASIDVAHQCQHQRVDTQIGNDRAVSQKGIGETSALNWRQLLVEVEPLPCVELDIRLTEVAQVQRREEQRVEGRFVVPHPTGCDDDGRSGVTVGKGLDVTDEIAAYRGVEQLVEPIEDDQERPGQQLALEVAVRGRALVLARRDEADEVEDRAPVCDLPRAVVPHDDQDGREPCERVSARPGWCAGAVCDELGRQRRLPTARVAQDDHPVQALACTGPRRRFSAASVLVRWGRT